MHLIKLDKDKKIIPQIDITYFLNPDYIYIPYIQTNIKQNAQVYKNEIISQEGKMSPISGKAIGIKKSNVNGKSQNTIVIANDFREFEKKAELKKRNITIPILLKLLEESKNQKLFEKFRNNKTFTSIIISAINDNPYVYNNIFLLKENINNLLDLLEKIGVLYKSINHYVVVKSEDSFVIDECLNLLGTYPKLKLTLVNDEYLLEKEEFLKNKLGITDNALYLSVEELGFIENLLANKINTTKLITISGDAIQESKVIMVKKYTLLKEVIDKYIKLDFPKPDYIINGLMTGYKITTTDDFVISDEIVSINIMKKKRGKESPCIKCGKCISVCPYGVNPLTLKNIDKCEDCGLCSYICPSRINLRKRLAEKRKILNKKVAKDPTKKNKKKRKKVKEERGKR